MKENINKLIDLLLKKCVNLQKNSFLYLTIPFEHKKIALKIKEKTEKEFNSEIFIEYTFPINEIVNKENYSFDKYKKKLNKIYSNKINSLKNNTSYLEIKNGLEYIDPNNSFKAKEVHAELSKLQTLFRKQKRLKTNVVSCKTVFPNKYWAKTLFNQEKYPLKKLWNIYFDITLVNKDNPLNLWSKKISDIQNRIKYLDKMQFQKIKFEDGFSNISFELIENHKWTGGCETTKSNIQYMPNFPTLEIFSAPKKNGVSGIIKNSKPLIYNNIEINDFYIKFKDGIVTDFFAKKNHKVLSEIINHDKNSHYVGEVAIVEGTNEISDKNIIFMNTLLDENAACHLALGCAYQCSLNKKINYDENSYEKHNMNFSQIHVDLMFGSKNINVTAFDKAGIEYKLLENGKWKV